MATTQQMLSAITNMQTNVQAAMPVIPNNGNPAGAYNMQEQAPSPGPAVPAGPPAIPWLEPSASMQIFQQQLTARQAVLDQQRMPAAQAAPVAQAPQTVVPMQQPVMPQQQQPILPQRQMIS
jgi:hypothetical protein